eukprot:scaffold3965_cov113-Skeletonema_dohrnii-CCMP3373.AAC.6
MVRPTGKDRKRILQKTFGPAGITNHEAPACNLAQRNANLNNNMQQQQPSLERYRQQQSTTTTSGGVKG